MVNTLFCFNYCRTVPRVFIGGNCIGGGQDIQVAKNNGKLEELLKAVNALEC